MNDGHFRLGDDGELYEVMPDPKPKRKRKRGDEDKPPSVILLVLGGIGVLLVGLLVGLVWNLSIPAPVSPTALTPSPLPTIIKTLYVNEYPTFTVYWKRALWENAISGTVLTEDFEKDTADYGVLSFPYLTGNGFLLKGQSSAQIVKDATLLSSGNFLHFRDWQTGLTFSFPNSTAVSAFGFDYRTSEAWQLTFDGTNIALPFGRTGFVGLVFAKDFPQQFILSSHASAQGGLSVDSISYH